MASVQDLTSKHVDFGIAVGSMKPFLLRNIS